MNIYVVVRGGVVQGVYGPKNVKVKVLDYDNEEDATETKMQEENLYQEIEDKIVKTLY